MSEKRGYQPTTHELERVLKDVRRGIYTPVMKIDTPQKARALRLRLESAYHTANHPKADHLWELASEFARRNDPTDLVYCYDELYGLIKNPQIKEKNGE